MRSGQKLVDVDDDFAFGVPFAEVPQRFGHLTQPIATVDDRGDLACLIKLNEGRQVLRTKPNGQKPDLLAFGPSDQRPDEQDLQERGHRSADMQIPSPGLSEPL